MFSVKPILSFCIPTYNRADCLKDLLDSLVANIKNREDIEIVISDNASADSTRELVQNYLREYSFIIYHQQKKNEGFDKNLEDVTLLASGKYIWFFGDDDSLEEGAIDYILPILKKSEYTMLFVNHVRYNQDFSKLLSQPSLRIHKNIEFSDGRQLFSFCKMRIQFISSIIIDRLAYIDQFGSSDMPIKIDRHIYYILNAISNMPCAVIAEPFVRTRTATDRTDLDRMGAYLKSIPWWWKIHFEIPNKIIEYCKKELNYSDELLRPIIDYQDSHFWRGYASNKKERRSNRHIPSLRQSLKIIHKKSTVVIFLILYVTPSAMLRLTKRVLTWVIWCRDKIVK